MGKGNLFAKLFGRSPFGPMQAHMKVVHECAESLIPLFEALAGSDDEGLTRNKERIFELEGQADDLKNEIRSHLPKSLFLPVDRRDLLDLLNSQDSIADTAQDIAGLLTLRRMTVPDFMGDDLLGYVRRNLDAVKASAELIGELDELVELGFRGPTVDKVEGMVAVLGAIETDTDNQGMNLTRLLFENEQELGPIPVFFWYELLELIGDIADYAEDVGDRLRLLIAR